MLDRLLKNLSLIIAASLAFSGCEEEQELAEPVPYFSDYVTISKGTTWSYTVDSLAYSDFDEDNKIDTFQYIIENEILKLIDSSGDIREYEAIRHYKKTDSSTPYQSVKYKIEKTQEQYRVFTNNRKTIKMTFPVRKGKSWDANAFNAQPEQTYRYRKVHAPFSNQGMQYDSTLTIVQEDEGSLISRNFSQEIYRLGAGMVFKEKLDLEVRDTAIPPASVPWEKKADVGYILRYHLNKYEP